MHAERLAGRNASMNTRHPILLLLAMSVALAACASPAASTSQSSDTASQAPASAPARMSVTPSPEGPEPTATPHDMGEMGERETVTVDIANFAFVPAELVISAGTEVVFTNSDSAPHTVTAGRDQEPMPEVFDSGLLQQGDSFSFVFDQPGEFAYFCDRHPPMTGTVVVEG